MLFRELREPGRGSALWHCWLTLWGSGWAFWVCHVGTVALFVTTGRLRALQQPWEPLAVPGAAAWAPAGAGSACWGALSSSFLEGLSWPAGTSCWVSLETLPSFCKRQLNERFRLIQLKWDGDYLAMKQVNCEFKTCSSGHFLARVLESFLTFTEGESYAFQEDTEILSYIHQL